MRLYCDGSPKTIAYVLDGGGSGYTDIPVGHTAMEAEYLAIMFGLTEFVNKWNKELDARQDDIDTEKMAATGKEEFARVSTPSQQTPRPLPPPVLVLSDNEVVVNQLSRQYHINNSRLRKLAQTIWDMTKFMEVKYEWISRRENLAGMMLK